MVEYVSPIPNDAIGLQPNRYVGDNDLRQYTPVEFSTKSPNMAIDQIYRQMKMFGCLSNNTDDEFGICDVLDSNGDVIHQFGLTNYGINWLYKKYDLRVAT